MPSLVEDITILLNVVDDLLWDKEKIIRNYGEDEYEQVLQTVERLRRYAEYPPTDVVARK